MTVIEKALSQLRIQLKDADENKQEETLTHLITRIQSLEQVKRALSVGLGGRTIIR
jgi:hypothetical protein